MDYRGTEVGIINVEIVPCSPQGKEYSENDDVFVDSPSEMIGKDLHVVVKGKVIVSSCHWIEYSTFHVDSSRLSRIAFKIHGESSKA